MENIKSGGSTVLNKILIPVITTVLGATAIYFLGYNKKSGRTDMEKMLITKEATVKAWKSFVTAQNIYYKNANSVIEEYTQKMADVPGVKQDMEKSVPVLRDFEEDILKESKKVNKDIHDILKDEDIDRDFVSMLNRTLDNGSNQEKKLVDFFDNFIAIAKSNRSEEEKKASIQTEVAKFEVMGKRMEERVTTEAEAIAKTLAERYNQAFDLKELHVYVEYKKENEKKNPDESANINKTDVNGPAPVDPNRGSEIKENVQNDNNPTYDYNNTNNQTEPTESLLTGNWTMTGGELELSKNGDMFWTFDGKGYTSGDWRLTDGKINMNATNPDTKKTSLIIGYLSNVTRNSFTITFMTNPREIYNFKRKNY